MAHQNQLAHFSPNVMRLTSSQPNCPLGHLTLKPDQFSRGVLGRNASAARKIGSVAFEAQRLRTIKYP